MNRITKAKSDGYIHNFKVTETGLVLQENEEFYFPNQVQIKENLLFNEAGHPSEKVILYLVETTDGHKGILINGHDNYADPALSLLIKQVEAVSKK